MFVFLRVAAFKNNIEASLKNIKLRTIKLFKSSTFRS